MSRKLLAAALGISVGTAAVVRADLLAYDSFSGPAASTLVGGGGGTGFSGVWQPGGYNASNSQNYVNAAGSLTYGNLSTADNHVLTQSLGAIGGATRALTTPLGAAGTTRYISVEFQPQGTLNGGAFNGFFGLYLNASTTTPTISQDLYFGKPGSGAFSQYVLEDRGGTNQHPTIVTPVVGRTDLLVLRADFASGTDTFTLYVNPPAGGTEPAGGTIKRDSDVGTVSSLTVYSTGAFALDEIRVGTTYADVVRRRNRRRAGCSRSARVPCCIGGRAAAGPASGDSNE